MSNLSRVVNHQYFTIFAGGLALGAGILLGLGIAQSGEPVATAMQVPMAVGAEASLDAPVTEVALQAKSSPSSQESSHELAMIWEGAKDPVKAVQQLLHEQDPYRRRRSLTEFCLALDAAGAKAALDYLLRNKAVAPHDRDLVFPLLTRWAELEPMAAADYAAGMASLSVNAIYTVIPTWAAKDPEAAMEWALKSRTRNVRQYSINSVVTQLAERDPKAALRILERMPRGENKIFYYSCIFDCVARRSPEEAAELAASVNTSIIRHKAAEQIALAWGESDPAAALDWFAENSAGDSDSGLGSYPGMSGILNNWVDRDPQAAAEYVSELPSGFARKERLSAVAKAWGAKDPQAAAIWLNSLPKGPQTQYALDALVSTWAEVNPRAAAEFLEGRSLTPADSNALDSIARQWVQKDAQGALEWARQQQDPAIERSIAALAISAIAVKDQPQALSYISQLKSSDARAVAIGSYVNKVASSDPLAALNWLMDLPEGFPMKSAFNTEISIWSRKDPKAVAQWIEQQGAGVHRDAAVNNYAEEIASKDAPAAAAWAGTISDAKMRVDRLQQVLGTWARNDHSAARTWVLQQGFAAEDQKAFLERIDKNRSK